MKFRRKAIPDLDGLTRHDVERIRGAAAASVTPGLEGFDRMLREKLLDPTDAETIAKGPIRSTDALPGKRVAKRAKPPQ